MPRTEKRFGVVNQPASTAVEELVPSAATTRNLLINATARSAAVIAAAVYSGAFSNDANANVSVSPGSASINMSNASTLTVQTLDGMFKLGKGTLSNVFVWTTGATSGLLAVDQSSLSSKYSTQNFTSHTGANYWRSSLDNEVGFKQQNSGQGGNAAERGKFNNGYVAVSETKAIGIAGNVGTSATADSDMFDAVTITHTVGTSITEGANNVGQTALQGTGATNGAHHAGAYALQDGVGYLLHAGTDFVYEDTASRVGLGIYIYSNSSTAFEKRAFWNCDGGASDKVSGYALAYFVASDYNSTHQVFAFSQPSTTTAWSNISPTSSTSFPAGYALPSAGAPAGFRIVSNSGTTEPDTNFLTGEITYPSAPTGVNVPTTIDSNYLGPVVSIKFSPEGNRVAVAYCRNYSGTGNTNSVVVVYTRQNDGSWTHTASSGSAIRYMPDNPDCMAWSPDGGLIAIAANSSTNTSTIPSATSYFIDVWAVGGGSSVIDNSAITSWTVAASKYPDFIPYTSPKSGTSAIGSTTINANTITGGSAANNYTLRCAVAFASSTTIAPTVAASIDGVTLTSSHRSLQGYVMQASGTVGTSGQPATNYVTSVISDLPLAAGQTSQVSNIVLGSGERLYVSSSTSNSVDISAHGVEST